MAQRKDVPGAKNLQMAVAGPVLSLYCDLSKDQGASASGKSVLISSSSGNKPLGKSGAFLGFNIYTKSLDKRDLSAAATAPLRTAGFVEVGDGCQWRLEEDEKTLCIKIDFSKVKKRLASSGKSMLLATTSGNKPIANTGLSCGLNCYHPAAGTFTVEGLGEGSSPAEELQVGQSTTVEGGFTIDYVSANELRIGFLYSTADMADGHVVSLPPFQMGNMTVALSVAAAKAARAKTESASASPSPTEGGGLLLDEKKKQKVRNVVVKCTTSEADSDAETPDTYQLMLSLDPTQSLGRSSSGKSMTVASTGGFQLAIDKEGRVVCRLSLNVYRPAPPIGDAEIKSTVQAVLSAKPKTTLADLSFKDVLAEVTTQLGVNEAMKETLKPRIKEEVKAFLEEAQL